MMIKEITYAAMPGGWEMVVIAIVILLLFGAKKLPELARGLGKGIREFQKAKDDLVDEVQKQSEATPEIKEPSQTKGPPS